MHLTTLNNRKGKRAGEEIVAAPSSLDFHFTCNFFPHTAIIHPKPTAWDSVHS
jgi:hypothetical protein